MIRSLTWMAILLVALTGRLYAAEDSKQAAEDPQDLLIDRILAVVDEDVVMLSELRVEASKLTSRLRQQGVDPMPSTAAIQKEAFDKLILNKLQLAEAARLGIEADEETVNRAVAAIAAAHVVLNKRDVRAAIGWTGSTSQAANDFADGFSQGDPFPGGAPVKVTGYDGPCPGSTHRYVFTLYALTGTIDHTFEGTLGPATFTPGNFLLMYKNKHVFGAGNLFELTPAGAQVQVMPLVRPAG